MKRLFLLLFSGMMGIFLAPEILAQADSFSIKTPVLNDPETIIVEPAAEKAEKAKEVEKVEKTKEETSTTPAHQASTKTTTNTTNTTNTTTLAPTPAKDNITILGRTISVSEVNSTAVDAGNEVKSFRKMLYGHNSGAVFGNLGNSYVGMTFTVTLSGVTKTYRVAEIITFEKISDTALSVDGQKYTMTALVNNAKGHSLMLMTCAGQSLGHGDATHRLTVFADEI